MEKGGRHFVPRTANKVAVCLCVFFLKFINSRLLCDEVRRTNAHSTLPEKPNFLFNSYHHDEDSRAIGCLTETTSFSPKW